MQYFGILAPVLSILSEASSKEGTEMELTSWVKVKFKKYQDVFVFEYRSLLLFDLICVLWYVSIWYQGLVIPKENNTMIEFLHKK